MICPVIEEVRVAEALGEAALAAAVRAAVDSVAREAGLAAREAGSAVRMALGIGRPRPRADGCGTGDPATVPVTDALGVLCR